jgi:hypothetical protein
MSFLTRLTISGASMSIICSTTHLLSPLAMVSDTLVAKNRRQG